MWKGVLTVFGRQLKDPKAKPIIEQMAAQAAAFRQALESSDLGVGTKALAEVGKGLKSLVPMVLKQHRKLIEQLAADASKPIDKKVAFIKKLNNQMKIFQKIVGKKIVVVEKPEIVKADW